MTDTPCRRVAVPTLLLLLSLTVSQQNAAAAPERARIAVLDLAVLDDSVKESDAQYLTESIRGAAARSLGRDFSVITRENIVDVLRAAGRSLSECSEAGCATEYGRVIGADFVVTGEILRFGDDLKIALRMHQTSPPELIGSVQWGAPTLRGLEDGLPGPTGRLFSALGGGGGDAGTARDGVLFLRADQPGVTYDIDDGVHTGTLEANKLTELRLPLRSRPYRVVLRADGFHEYRGDVLLQGDRRTHTVDHRFVRKVVVKPTSGQGILDLRSTPANAEIVVDGVVQKKRTPQSLDLPAGPHLVEIRRKLYRPWARQVTVKAGDIVPLDATLEEDFGALVVETEPREAEIYLDGRRVGSGRYENPQQIAGGYTLRVEAPLYHPFDGTVFVERRGDTRQPVRLRPAHGSILLDVRTDADDEAGTLPDVYLDGGPSAVAWQSSPTGTGRRYTATIERVPSGSHQVEVQLPRYAVWTDTVTVADGKATTAEAVLDARFGTLRVTSSPPGAPVRVDGAMRGRTPLAVPVDVGTYAIEIEAPEPYYRGLKRDVAIRKGETSLVQVRLEERIGGLTIATDPPDAEILVDDKPAGRSPLKLTGLRVGRRRIEARHEGYTPTVSEQEVREGELRVVRVVLEEKGSVEVVCVAPPGDAKGVKMVLDGEDFYETYEGPRQRFQRLPEGRYRAICRSPHGFSTSKDVDVRPGKHQSIQIDLTDPEILRREIESRRTAHGWWGAGLILGGAAAAGVGGYYIWKAGDEHSQAEASFERALLATDQAAYSSALADVSKHQDSRDTATIVGWSLVGGSAALVAAGITVLALMPDKPTPPSRYRGEAPAGGGYEVGVVPLPGGAAFTIQGTFGRAIR